MCVVCGCNSNQANVGATSNTATASVAESAPLVNPRTGDLRLWRVVEVVEHVDDYFKQVDLKAAEKLQPGAKVVDGFDNIMPTFQGLLRQNEMDGLVAYIKSLQ